MQACRQAGACRGRREPWGPGGAVRGSHLSRSMDGKSSRGLCLLPSPATYPQQTAAGPFWSCWCACRLRECSSLHGAFAVAAVGRRPVVVMALDRQTARACSKKPRTPPLSPSRRPVKKKTTHQRTAGIPVRRVKLAEASLRPPRKERNAAKGSGVEQVRSKEEQETAKAANRFPGPVQDYECTVGFSSEPYLW